MKSQNNIDKNITIQSGYALAINPASVSASTFKFIQGYNTSAMLTDKRDAVNNSLFQAIGLHTIPGQMTTVLCSADFRNPQTKQTFKISIQRYFRNTFTGKALVIAGNTCIPYTLASDETTDFKGKVIKVIDVEQKAIDDSKKKADKEALLLSAEQAVLQIDNVKIEKDQALATVATLTKKQNDHDKEIKEIKDKNQSALDILTAQNKALTIALERSKHETSATIAQYNELKAMILGKTTIQQLRSKVSGITLKSSKPEFTNQELNAAVNA